MLRARAVVIMEGMNGWPKPSLLCHVRIIQFMVRNHRVPRHPSPIFIHNAENGVDDEMVPDEGMAKQTDAVPQLTLSCQLTQADTG